MRPYFENLEKIIINQIESASESVLIAVCWFTNKNIYDSICRKLYTGVKVEIVIDSDLANFGRNGLNFKLIERLSGKLYVMHCEDDSLMHNKYCIIDNNTIITGSYNWSNKSKNNKENIIIVKNAARTLYLDYKLNFSTLVNVSTRPYTISNLDQEYVISRSKPAIFPYRAGKKWGYCDKKKNVIISASYDFVFPFRGNEAVVQQEGKEFEITINQIFEIIKIKQKDSSVSNHDEYGSNEIAKLDESTSIEYLLDSEALESSIILMKRKHQDNYFITNLFGDWINNTAYEDVADFLDGMCRVKRDGLYGFIDLTGKEVIRCTYHRAFYFSSGLAAVCKYEKWGFIDRTNKTKIHFEYDYATIFNKHGLAEVGVRGKYGFIDRNNQPIIAIKYDNINTYNDLILVDIDGKTGIIDYQNNIYVPIIFDEMSWLSSNIDTNLFTVSINSKKGLINSKGNIMIPCIHEDIWFYSQNGTVWVFDNDFWTMYTVTGEIISDKKYKHNPSYFHEGLYLIDSEDGKFYVDDEGIEYWID